MATATATDSKRKKPLGPDVDYVVVPRDMFTEAIWSRSWNDVRTMADRGERGLSLLTTPSPMQWDTAKRVIRYNAEPHADIPSWRELSEVALLRAGDAPRQQMAWLHVQGW